MTSKQQYLLHQIHPVKLLTDASAGFVSLVPLWRHELVVAFVIMLVPPLIASWLVIRYANLERQRNSWFGRYVVRTMTRAMEFVRLGGFVVMAVGAWKQSPLAIAFGVAVVLFGWLRGVWFPVQRREP